jgi:hypothetical protein
MADSLILLGRILGSKSVIGMAAKVGLSPPPPPISVRHLIDLVDPPLPLAPVDLLPANGARNVSANPIAFFRDPAIGTKKAAVQFELFFLHDGITVGSPPLTGPILISNPVSPPGFKIDFLTLPQGEVTLTVRGSNRAGRGPSSSTIFTVGSPSPPPRPTHLLTLRVGIAGFGQQRNIKTVAMVITGPGVPAGAIPFQLSQDGSTATALMPLPPPAGQVPVRYTVNAKTSFHFDGLINTNTGSISGPEDAQVDLTAPATILWTGQSRLARFSVTHDDFNNVFIMSFDGLI